jgi:glycolate oxidase iron-sulfur subunit
MRHAERRIRHHGAPSQSAIRNPQSAMLFRGCVMDGLFSHVHDATVRALAVNGYAAGGTPGQGCCGALHAHAGLLAEARALARRNLDAFGSGDAPIVVNSAGCGAMLKEYAHLLPDDPRAGPFAARVRDVSELLASYGPEPGGPLPLRVAYDPPCHLEHAQRIGDPPRRVLAAIPDLEVVETPGAAQCCGSAGLYSLTEPALSRAVLLAKLAELRAAAPQVVATGNPGCQLHIGAGLAAAGIRAEVRHPVELLDRAYRAAGRYA